MYFYLLQPPLAEAAIEESFEQSSDSTKPSLQDGVWIQVGDLVNGGRGVSDKGSMELKAGTAETEVLTWDGSNSPVDFYYKLGSCKFSSDAVLLVEGSPDGRNWTTLWKQTGGELAKDAWTLVSVNPVVGTTAKSNGDDKTFAVRWEAYNVPYDLCSFFLDEMSLPAKDPSAKISHHHPFQRVQ